MPLQHRRGLRYSRTMPPPRRFPPPWIVEELCTLVLRPGSDLGTLEAGAWVVAGTFSQTRSQWGFATSASLSVKLAASRPRLDFLADYAIEGIGASAA